jgi:hypothetical protein
MKTIIAGSRNIENANAVQEAILESKFTITEVVSGGAVGIDQIGEDWARRNNVRMTRFMPEWTTYGKAAGVIRNGQMAKYADALIAVWDGKSRGTKNMIDEAKKLGLKVYVKIAN